MLSPVYTQENFPWTDNFSLSCELPCATNGFKTKEIFLSKENFPVCKRALRRLSTILEAFVLELRVFTKVLKVN